ncbi:MAG TPA: hypothetical protein VMW78_05210 [Anaerolineae bacterium]|nr:hypothetical protein [Anaerolineae bacterium]
MTEKVYKAPESNPVSEKIGNKRPTSITIICVVGFIGALLSVPLFFSAIAKSMGVWYQLYLALVSIMGLVCMVGLWKMKKWAAYTYAGFVSLNQFVMLAMGIWNIGALIMPGVVVAFALAHSKKMS